jgi:hypothetical protein
MTSVAIFIFLVGAVLAWGFRVWILVPITLSVVIAVLVIELVLGAPVLTAIGQGLMLGLAPQLGYAFGLLGRYGLVMARPTRNASVAVLYKQHPQDQKPARATKYVAPSSHR